MKNIQILLFFLLCYFNIINFCNTGAKQKTNNSTFKNEANNKYNKKSNQKLYFTRKLHIKIPSLRKLDIDGNLESEEELDFVSLKILIDTKELNDTCPDELKRNLNNILVAMKNAQKILEDFIILGVDGTAEPDYFEGGYDTFQNRFEISYSDPFFTTEFKLNESYNYFIFGKFIGNDAGNEINEDSSSLILDGYYGVPCTGIIFFNKNIDKSKLTLEYLKPLMLHHFIRLLGFNYQVIQPDNGNYILNKDEYSSVIDYAIKYFDCSDITSIVLSEEDERHYKGSDEHLIGLYWPKEIFSGELLTKFDISEGNFLSGFTLAFLNDLPYIRFKNGYIEDLTYFGNNKGCQCKCNYFTTGIYENDFWNCNACIGGFFMAIESSESEKHCENNNNKDQYFLYNEESQIYKKCKSEISNCQKCSSKTKCTSCYKGYELKEEDGKIICEENDGLSTGAIIGIVFGCVGLLAIVALIIIYILKRRNAQKKEKLKEKEEIPEKKDVDTVPQNVKNGQEDSVKVIVFKKNNEIIDADAEIKKDDA